MGVILSPAKQFCASSFHSIEIKSVCIVNILLYAEMDEYVFVFVSLTLIRKPNCKDGKNQFWILWNAIQFSEKAVHIHNAQQHARARSAQTQNNHRVHAEYERARHCTYIKFTHLLFSVCSAAVVVVVVVLLRILCLLMIIPFDSRFCTDGFCSSEQIWREIQNNMNFLFFGSVQHFK